MDYTVTQSTDGTFIVLKVIGDITRKIALQLNIEAHALGRQLKINRYLVDVTESRNTDTVLENYEFSYSDMRKTEAIDKCARVATLVSANDDSHDFVMTTARNAGLNVRLFNDMEQAKQFLRDGVVPKINSGEQ